MSFVLCSYYTFDTPYREEIRNLILSVKDMPLQTYFKGIENRGSWEANTHYKAQFIKEMMDRYPEKAIVYVDADAVVRKYPALFDTIPPCDLAAYFRDWRFAKNELLSGTLYVGNTEAARNLIDLWIKKNGENPGVWEQKNLHSVIALLDGDLRISKLPVEYCCIYDSVERKAGCQPVIEHFQRSRRYRKAINAR